MCIAIQGSERLSAKCCLATTPVSIYSPHYIDIIIIIVIIIIIIIIIVNDY